MLQPASRGKRQNSVFLGTPTRPGPTSRTVLLSDFHTIVSPWIGERNISSTLEVLDSQETEIGEPPMSCSTTKSGAFNCGGFDMICPRRKRRFLLRASRPD